MSPQLLVNAAGCAIGVDARRAGTFGVTSLKDLSGYGVTWVMWASGDN